MNELKLMLVLFVACAKEMPPTQTVSIAPPPAPTQTVAPVVAPPRAHATSDTVRVDKTVRLRDCVWHVIEARNAGNKLRSTSEFSDEEKQTEGRFVMVHFELTNLGTKDEMMLDRPKIQDDKGRQFGPIDMESFYVPARTKTIALDALPPSVTREYWTVIELPTDAVRLQFMIHGFSLLSSAALVDLNL